MNLRDALLESAMSISRRDAETLLGHTLHRERAWLLAHTEDELAAKDLESFRAFAARRAAQEPLQYITGTQEFFGLSMRVTRDVLIPRPETEHLVEAVLDWAHKQSDLVAGASLNLRIVDVGTGSGAIAIALASALDRADVTAVELSPAALAVARENAGRNRVTGHVTGRVRFLEGDLLAPVAAEQPFDVVVSNPPYVALSEAQTLAPEVRDHEPPVALYAGPDGLEIYRRLVPQAFDVLRPGGLLALEIGFGQQQPLTELLSTWKDVHFLDDYASIPRVVLASRP